MLKSELNNLVVVESNLISWILSTYSSREKKPTPSGTLVMNGLITMQRGCRHLGCHSKYFLVSCNKIP